MHKVTLQSTGYRASSLVGWLWVFLPGWLAGWLPDGGCVHMPVGGGPAGWLAGRLASWLADGVNVCVVMTLVFARGVSEISNILNRYLINYYKSLLPR